MPALDPMDAASNCIALFGWHQSSSATITQPSNSWCSGSGIGSGIRSGIRSRTGSRPTIRLLYKYLGVYRSSTDAGVQVQYAPTAVEQVCWLLDPMKAAVGRLEHVLLARTTCCSRVVAPRLPVEPHVSLPPRNVRSFVRCKLKVWVCRHCPVVPIFF